MSKPKIVARFYVQSFAKKAGDTATVVLAAATSKENADWSTYTPSGQITMELTRKASGARESFESVIGQDCLVTFDFNAPERETPERAKDADGNDIGYAAK